MTSHVFVVDERTFPLHLRYQFAGIGAGNNDQINFNNSSTSNLNSQTEKTLVGMIADMSRIRKGDRIFFYVQKEGSRGNDGVFCGVFRACGRAFLDNDGKEQFLRDKLGKSLTFRVLIEPEEVYSAGVSEWHALEEIRRISHPHKMLWSLIYRKLKGGRGCTMITHYEDDYLFRLIRESGRPLNAESQVLNFDQKARAIVAEKGARLEYTGEQTPFNMLPRMLAVANRWKIEIFLQAMITAHIGNANDLLTRILLGEDRLSWIGNEVKCGLGMQSMDIVLACEGQQQRLLLLELKSDQPIADNILQMRRYVDWADNYYIPNSSAIIEPMLIARETPGDLPADFVRTAAEFDKENAGKTCAKLRLVEFEIRGGQLHYQERKIGN